MKILHVVSSVNKSGGGTSEVVPRLAMEQCKLGHDVSLTTIVSNMSDAMKDAISAGVRYFGESKVSWFSPDTLGVSLEFKRTLMPIISDVDMVHLHGLWTYPPWCAGWLAKKLRKPYVMMPHGFLEPERLKISRWKKRIVGYCIEKPLLRNANAIIATSPSEEDGIRAYGLSNPVYIMPIGLDTRAIDQGVRNDELLGRLGCDTTKKHILYFSRITPIKGLDLLAEAWGKINHTGWQLLIVGPDDRGYAAEVQRMCAAQITQGSVVMHGPVYGQDKYDLLKSVEAFVLPTRSENWSIAVAEALAAGLPVVCTKGAPWQCINDVNAGCWVDISPDGVAEGLRRIMALDDQKRGDMGINGRRWVEDNLRWDVIAHNMIEFYKKVCEAK